MSDTNEQRRQRVITILNRRLDEKKAELGTLEKQYVQIKEKATSSTDVIPPFSSQKELLQAEKEKLDEEKIKLEERVEKQRTQLNEILPNLEKMKEIREKAENRNATHLELEELRKEKNSIQEQTREKQDKVLELREALRDLRRSVW